MAKPNSYGICLYKTENKKIYIYLNKTSSVSDWNFFKGKQEENESIKETAQREMLEETNIYIEKKKFERFYEQKNKTKNIGIFLVDKDNINFNKLELNKKEIQEGRWLDIEKEIKFSKNQRKIYNKIASHLFSKFLYLYRDIRS